jgi:hypothetical protein
MLRKTFVGDYGLNLYAAERGWGGFVLAAERCGVSMKKG